MAQTNEVGSELQATNNATLYKYRSSPKALTFTVVDKAPQSYHEILLIFRTPNSFATNSASLSSAMMSSIRLLRPASRLLSSSIRPSTVAQSYRPAAVTSSIWKRTFATPKGGKEMTVREALNEALAEEMESNDKVFLLGEEVAQYNGA